MNYYIKTFTTKPTEDINRFVEIIGYSPVSSGIRMRTEWHHFWAKMYIVLLVLLRLHRGDLLLIQYPYKKCYALTCMAAHLKGAKVITLIHDLNSFRRKRISAEKENSLLMHTDYLICHNDSMRRFLVEHGFSKPIGTLELFDYIAAVHIPASSEPHRPWQVTYAGGLGYKRSPFLYDCDLDSQMQGWELQLYGRKFLQERAGGWKNIHYNGLFTPEQLINEVEGDFGLVWDGDSIDQCSGPYGEYLRINNPHKASFSLRMGLPVIIWRQAALAKFVQENGIGICIDSLRDLNDVLACLSPEEYSAMRRNVEKISQRVGTGYYTHSALRVAEEALCNV